MRTNDVNTPEGLIQPFPLSAYQHVYRDQAETGCQLDCQSAYTDTL